MLIKHTFLEESKPKLLSVNCRAFRCLCSLQNHLQETPHLRLWNWTEVYILTACLHEMGICEYVNIAHYKAACKVTGWYLCWAVPSGCRAEPAQAPWISKGKRVSAGTQRKALCGWHQELSVSCPRSAQCSHHIPGSTGLPRRGSPAALSSSAPQRWGTWCHQCQLFFLQYLQTVQRNFDGTSIPCYQELMIITNIYFVIK